MMSNIPYEEVVNLALAFGEDHIENMAHEITNFLLEHVNSEVQTFHKSLCSALRDRIQMFEVRICKVQDDALHAIRDRFLPLQQEQMRKLEERLLGIQKEKFLALKKRVLAFVEHVVENKESSLSIKSESEKRLQLKELELDRNLQDNLHVASEKIIGQHWQQLQSHEESSIKRFLKEQDSNHEFSRRLRLGKFLGGENTRIKECMDDAKMKIRRICCPPNKIEFIDDFLKSNPSPTTIIRAPPTSTTENPLETTLSPSSPTTTEVAEKNNNGAEKFNDISTEPLSVIASASERRDLDDSELILLRELLRERENEMNMKNELDELRQKYFLNISWAKLFAARNAHCKSIDKKTFLEYKMKSLCSKLPSSTYGYIINDLLSQQDIWSIPIQNHFIFILVVLIQLSMSWYLFQSSQLSVKLDSIAFMPLQVTAIGVFLLNLIPSVMDIILEVFAILHSDCYFFDNTEEEGTCKEILQLELQGKENLWSIVCLWLVIALESLVLIAVFFVGNIYILSRSDASDLVQACVAVVFIIEIDNIAFDNLTLGCTRDFYEKQLFHFPKFLPSSAESFRLRYDNGSLKFQLRTLFETVSAFVLLLASVITITIVRYFESCK